MNDETGKKILEQLIFIASNLASIDQKLAAISMQSALRRRELRGPPTRRRGGPR
jgi:hypothetical protein